MTESYIGEFDILGVKFGEEEMEADTGDVESDAGIEKLEEVDGDIVFLDFGTDVTIEISALWVIVAVGASIWYSENLGRFEGVTGMVGVKEVGFVDETFGTGKECPFPVGFEVVISIDLGSFPENELEELLYGISLALTEGPRDASGNDFLGYIVSGSFIPAELDWGEIGSLET